MKMNPVVHFEMPYKDPKRGKFVMFKDTESNRVGMLQPSR